MQSESDILHFLITLLDQKLLDDTDHLYQLGNHRQYMYIAHHHNHAIELIVEYH